MVIDVHFVDHIALVRTGKYRHSVSKLKITPEVFAQYKLAQTVQERGDEDERRRASGSSTG